MRQREKEKGLQLDLVGEIFIQVPLKSLQYCIAIENNLLNQMSSHSPETSGQTSFVSGIKLTSASFLPLAAESLVCYCNKLLLLLLHFVP